MNAMLFLDFDGVLHPLWTPPPFNDWQLEVTLGPTPYAGPFFVHASALTAVLSPLLEHLEIVVSSTWGKDRTLDELRGLLPAPVAARVIDAVHHHLPPTTKTRSRWEEISWYLQNVRPPQGSRWLALDDDDSGWPAAMRLQLVHCKRDLGDSEMITRLEAALAERCWP
ncbi:HAD domain-containing protein [Pseudoxanthomonas mexicana]|uniref:HAD domain-containing protein n=1 Tax=Pseudoxanthomonas mexicana TaxID=128785 RepID=UPI003D2F572B